MYQFHSVKKAALHLVPGTDHHFRKVQISTLSLLAFHKVSKSRTVPEIPEQLEPMISCKPNLVGIILILSVTQSWQLLTPKCQVPISSSVTQAIDKLLILATADSDTASKPQVTNSGHAEFHFWIGGKISMDWLLLGPPEPNKSMSLYYQRMH